MAWYTREELQGGDDDSVVVMQEDANQGYIVVVLGVC